MDYLDEVYVALKDRSPGKYPIDRLKEPQKFVSAVKELIDAEYLVDVEFSSDYKFLIVLIPFDQLFEKSSGKLPARLHWHERNNN